ncbi:MAG: hypothetical protein GY950_12770, partial [bacterium]|nr:hypothetical protein [bacterium]
MLLGSLFVLYTGYESLRHKEYQKFLSSVAGYRRIFFSVVSWRASFSIFFFFLVTGASLLLVRLNGIKIPGNEFRHLLVYVVVMVMMLLFFFVGGLVGGSLKSRVTGVITVICLWFALVFFVPWLVQAIMLKSSESIRSNCRMELEKLMLLMNFEKEAYQKVGIFKSGKEAPAKVKELVEGYWQNEFKAILAVEESLKDELKRNIRRFETVSLFFPTTFYLLTNNSISSKGYGNFIAFYDYVQRLKQDFFRFYLDRKFYSDFSGVESFVRKDENIYFAHSRLPGNILAGIAVMFFYAGGGFVFSFNRFKAFLFEQPGSAAKDLDGLDVELKKKETYVLLTGGSVVNNQVYNVLSGQGKGFKGNIRLDDEALVTGCRFVYLCPPGQVPGDIRVGDFIRFVRKLLKVSNKAAAELYLRLGVEHIEDKTFLQLSPVERADVFLAAAFLKKSPLYMFHDFTRGKPEDFITRFAGQLQRLKEQGAAVLYLTDDVLLASKIGDSAGSLRAAAAAASPKLDTSGLV